MGVVLKPGWLYFLRDRDYRSGSEGDYVKIGLTNFERPVADRIDDHQTGNPRELYSLHEMQVSAISTVENYLHHQYAVSRVHGEWFEMSDSQIGEAIEKADQLNELIERHREEIELGMEIYNMPSNGVVREASEDDLALGEEWLRAKERHLMAKSTSTLHRERLLRMMGACRGIEGVVDFQDKVRSASTDKSAIKKLHPDLVDRYSSIKASVSGILKAEFANPSLKDLDESLADRIKIEKAGKHDGSEPDDYDDSPAPRAPEIEEAHVALLSSLGEERESKINLDLAVDRAKAACGMNDGIEGVCRWKRVEVETPVIDWKGLEEDNPDVVDANTTPEKRIAAFKVKPYRPY